MVDGCGLLLPVVVSTVATLGCGASTLGCGTSTLGSAASSSCAGILTCIFFVVGGTDSVSALCLHALIILQYAVMHF